MEDEDDGVHRLPGTSDVQGGLIIKKKSNPEEAKTPRSSLLGLDKLAAALKNDKSRLISFGRDEDEDEDEGEENATTGEFQRRRYRQPHEETPTYTGGLTEEAKQRMLERMQKLASQLYIYTFTFIYWDWIYFFHSKCTYIFFVYTLSRFYILFVYCWKFNLEFTIRFNIIIKM